MYDLIADISFCQYIIVNIINHLLLLFFIVITNHLSLLIIIGINNLLSINHCKSFIRCADREKDSEEADLVENQIEILKVFSKQLNYNEMTIYQTIDWLTKSLTGRLKVS